MLSETKVIELIHPIQLMYKIMGNVPGSIIALNTSKGIQGSELEEFNIKDFKNDPSYVSEIYLRDAEYMRNGLKPDCYMLGAWSNINVIDVRKVPPGMSIKELKHRKDEFSKTLEVYQVMFFMKDYIGTISLKVVDNDLEVLTPPGFVDNVDMDQFLNDGTNMVVKAFQSIFDLR